MKYINICLICLISVSTAAELKQEESWKLESRLSGYFQKIDIENGSSDKEKFSQSHELDVKYHGPLAKGNAGIEVRARGTNDTSIQKNDAHLLSFKGYYTTKYWNFEAGDVAASMNPYVYGGTVKGLKIQYKGNEKKKNWDYKFISGVKKAQWRETYQTVTAETLDTYVAAFEAKYTHERAKEIRISMATLKDDLNSGDLAEAPGKKGTTLGMDGKWRFNKYITLKGRAALSRSTDDERANKPMSNQNALQLRLLTRPVLSSVKSNFMYQRISSDFISMAGSANGDNEKLENMTTWKINKQLRARLSLKGSRDNLDGALGAAQKTYYEALTFSYKPVVIKRANVDFKLTNKDVKGRGVDTTQYTVGINGNVRQKSGFRYGLGYDYAHLSDQVTATASSTINNIRAILGYKQKLQGDASYRFTVTVDAQNMRQNANNEDKYGLKIDAGYKHDKRLSMDLGFTSRNTYKDESNDLQNSTYQFRTTYRLDDKGKNVVRLLLEKRDYDVDNDSDASYNEHIGKLSYVMNF
ncbi:MAG: hypothetical protein U9N30_09960 [Campylobacterota bacterium]|nr:hypothetical protein [Campylobacterota bacterium]